MPTLTATAETATARVKLTATGGTPGDVLYLFRRDSAGVGIVRDTSEATVVWPSSGSVIVYDHEARQGESTDYLLSDADGVQLVSTNLTVPLWGTWLKAPARPYLNTRCYLEAELPTSRAARRVVANVEGSDLPVVLSQRRAGRVGALRLLALTTDQRSGVSRLLDGGETLMLDTDPAWDSPWRYVSIGDVTTSRAYFDDRGLQLDARTFELAGVTAVAAPIGVTAVDQGRAYSQLPTLFATYAGLAATVATYEELAVGDA